MFNGQWSRDLAKSRHLFLRIMETDSKAHSVNQHWTLCLWCWKIGFWSAWIYWNSWIKYQVRRRLIKIFWSLCKRKVEMDNKLPNCKVLSDMGPQDHWNDQRIQSYARQDLDAWAIYKSCEKIVKNEFWTATSFDAFWELNRVKDVKTVQQPR